MTPSRSTFTSPLESITVSSASSHGTLRSVIDILPFTSSPMTMLRPLSAARMRRRFTTSASLKSREIRRWPFVASGGCTAGAGVTGAGVTGAGVAGVVGAWATTAGPVGFASVGAGLGSAASAGAGALGVAGRAGFAAVAGFGPGSAAATVEVVGMTIASPSLSSRIA